MKIPKKFRAWNGSSMEEVWELSLYPDGFTKVNDDVDSHFNNWPVMQYTGVQDDFGVEIYEGDIIEFWLCYSTTQTHTGDNIPGGSYTEPDEPVITKVHAEVVYDNDRAKFSFSFVNAPPYQASKAVHFWDESPPIVDKGYYTLEYLRGVLDPDYEFNTVPTSEEYWETLRDFGFETEKQFLKEVNTVRVIGNIYS